MTSEEGTGRPVTKSLTTEIDLEATEECNILFAESISFKRSPGNELVDKHFISCGLFTTSSMHAAIFLGKDSSENLHSVRNTDQKPTVQKLFDVTQKLIREQKLEISRVSELCWGNFTCEKLALVDDEEVIQLMKAKVHVFSDSVLCVGKMGEFPEPNAEWERRISWFKNTNQHSELDGIDGEPVEILHEIQRLWIPWSAHLMISKDELSSCRCFNDIERGHEDNKKVL